MSAAVQHDGVQHMDEEADAAPAAAAAATAAPAAARPPVAPVQRVQLRSAAPAHAAAAAPAAAASSSIPWDEMDSADQVLAFDSLSAALDCMVGSWWPGAQFESEIESWSQVKLRELNAKLPFSSRKTKAALAKELKERVRLHAAAHPDIVAEAMAKQTAGGHATASPSEEEEEEEEEEDEEEEEHKAAVKQLASPARLSRSAAERLQQQLLQQQQPQLQSAGAAAQARQLAALRASRNLPLLSAAAAAAPLRRVAAASTPPRASKAIHKADLASAYDRIAQPLLRHAAAIQPEELDGEADAAGEYDDAYDDEAEPQQQQQLQQQQRRPAASSSAEDRAIGVLRGNDMHAAMDAYGVRRLFAPGFIANARYAGGGRSMYELYKFDVTTRYLPGHEHSKHESLALARIIDAASVGDIDEVLELACRRLGGVQTAAETGSWQMCEQLESNVQRRSFVPASFMQSALKAVTQSQAIAKTVQDGARQRAGTTGGYGAGATFPAAPGGAGTGGRGRSGRARGGGRGGSSGASTGSGNGARAPSQPRDGSNRASSGRQ